MFTRAFWQDVAERASSTFAQAFLAALALSGFTMAVETGAIAAGLSVLKGLAALRTGGTSSASLLPAKTLKVLAKPKPPA